MSADEYFIQAADRAHEMGAKDRGDAGTDGTERSGMKDRQKMN
jgi:hypothetical protein